MSNLNELYTLLGYTPEPVPETKPNELPKVTFVLTSCGRVDLLEQTLDSFFKHNKYPIERYIITEDSCDQEVYRQCEQLNSKKYGGKLEFMFNEKKKGQARSIDDAYKTITTPYIFHCEEDWEFYNSDFINQSIKVLEADPTILQAWIRPKADNILNNIDSEVEVIGGVKVRKVLPVSFRVKGAGIKGGDLVVHNYMGFSWNPGLKRLSDYKKLQYGYADFGHEHEVDAFYRSEGMNYRVVSISTNDGEGYVKHIGWNRRVPSQIHGSDKIQSLDELPKEKPKVLLPKISVVMQAYLGEYPGSRSNSIQKFHRAVSSFLKQDYKNSELIIVSDGCKIVHEEVLKYANIPAIKYVYVSKEGAANMYEATGTEKFYRGIPRAKGVELATGELVTYMDSDDYLTPKFLHNILYAFNTEPNSKWWLNNTWYDHRIMSTIAPEVLQVIANYDGKIYKFEELNAEFVQTVIKEGLIVNTPWLLTHRRDCGIEWRDTTGTSEDVDFSRRLRTAHPKGTIYSRPGYIRCHYSSIWDV